MPVMYCWIRGCEDGLQTKMKCPSTARTAAQIGWREKQVVTEIDRIEPGVTGAVSREPTPCGTALAILFLAAIVRGNELRRQREHAVVTRSHHGGGEKAVEIFGLAAAARPPG